MFNFGLSLLILSLLYKYVKKLTFEKNNKMKLLTLKIKDAYYALFLQFLRSLTYVEIETTDSQTEQTIEEQTTKERKKKKFTVVNILTADRDYTFNREELCER